MVRTGCFDVSCFNFLLPFVSDLNRSNIGRTLLSHLVPLMIDCGHIALGPLRHDSEENIPIELAIWVSLLLYLISGHIPANLWMVLDLRPSSLYRELGPPTVNWPALKYFGLEALLLARQQLLHKVHTDMVKVWEAPTV